MRSLVIISVAVCLLLMFISEYNVHASGATNAEAEEKLSNMVGKMHDHQFREAFAEKAHQAVNKRRKRDTRGTGDLAQKKAE